MRKDKDERLIEIIKADQKLAQEVRIEFIQLAKSFLDDFKVNLTLTSIELDHKYPFGMDSWKDFLNHASIKKYIDGFVKELISKNVDTALATGSGSRDAINVKKEMERMGNDSTNEMFVIFRLPDKEEPFEPSGEL